MCNLHYNKERDFKLDKFFGSSSRRERSVIIIYNYISLSSCNLSQCYSCILEPTTVVTEILFTRRVMDDKRGRKNAIKNVRNVELNL